MGIATEWRYSNKRGGPSSAAPSSRVCFHWRAGRCNRRPCPFLHSELPPSDGPAAAPPKRANPGPPSKCGEAADRVCRYFLAGKCSYGDGCRFLHSWFVGDSFSLLTPLQGHQKAITEIALPTGSNKLYSGSNDETLRAWNCHTGQCDGVLHLGGEVGCMISEGPWIFVGIPWPSTCCSYNGSGSKQAILWFYGSQNKSLGPHKSTVYPHP